MTSTSVSTEWAWKYWEGLNEEVSISELKKAEAIVVLGGFMAKREIPEERYYAGEGVDRILEGIRLFEHGLADRIILTGGSYPGTEGPVEAVLMKRFLQEFSNIPDSSILVEDKSANTYENGLYTRDLLDSLNITPSIIMITSAGHMPRAKMVFESFEFELQVYPTDFTTISPYSNGFPYRYLPAVQNMNYVSSIWREIIGYWYYRLFIL
jgi:uncharacterized SAM-binding protein YcdF (DUF218 family)